jgi:hypothetical protein
LEPASGATGSASGTPGGLVPTHQFCAISALSVKQLRLMLLSEILQANYKYLKAVQTRHLVHYTLCKNRNLIGRYSDGLKKRSCI